MVKTYLITCCNSKILTILRNRYIFTINKFNSIASLNSFFGIVICNDIPISIIDCFCNRSCCHWSIPVSWCINLSIVTSRNRGCIHIHFEGFYSIHISATCGRILAMFNINQTFNHIFAIRVNII